MMHAEKEGYKIPVYMTFERVTSLNFTKDKHGTKHTAVDKNGKELPHVGINKEEKSFPVFITTFTVVDKETKEKFNTTIIRCFLMRTNKSILFSKAECVQYLQFCKRGN